MPYVYSTMATDMLYVRWKKNTPEGHAHQREAEVLIKGGHGVADKNLHTPWGVVTKVTNEEAEIIKSCPVYQRYHKDRCIVIQDKEIHVEKVLTNMDTREPSSPKVPQDFKLKKGEKGPKYVDKKPELRPY